MGLLLGVGVRASAVGVRASGVDVGAVRVRISARDVAVAVAKAESVAVAQVRRAVAGHAQHDRYERKERAECETGQEKGFHMPLNWLVGVLLVWWGVNRMYGRRTQEVAQLTREIPRRDPVDDSRLLNAAAEHSGVCDAEHTDAGCGRRGG